jgi:uncharacterized membrane protein
MRTQADIKMEIAVGHLLRIGVSVAAAVVLTGWVMYLAQAHGMAPNYRQFHGKPIPVMQAGSIFKGAILLDSRSVIESGLLLLIATPVARVILCVIDFARQKDKLYVAVSSIVLAVLVYSIFFRR